MEDVRRKKRRDNYACVYFTDEQNYACVRVKSIAYDTTLYPTTSDLIGKLLAVAWEDNEESYQAEIVAIGQKSEMSNLAADKAQEASNLSFEEHENSSGRGKRQRRPLVAAENILDEQSEDIIPIKRKKSSSSGELPVHVDATIRELVENSCSNGAAVSSSVQSSVVITSPSLPVDFTLEGSQSDSARIIAEKDEEILKLRQQLQNVTNKAYKFRKLQILDENREVETIDIGTSFPVRLPKDMVENIKDRYRLRPQQFLRALMEHTGLFTLEQIAACSVYGNKAATSPNDYVRPALGPAFLALKAFTVSQCGLATGSSALMKFEESVRRICSDARKRMKKMKGIK